MTHVYWRVNVSRLEGVRNEDASQWATIYVGWVLPTASFSSLAFVQVEISGTTIT